MRLDNRRFDVDAIKRDHTVELVAAGYGVELKPSGRGLVGRCPFHDDDQPSFYVYPQTRSWYCYGECRAGGDVIKFLQLKENVGFVQACELLDSQQPPSAPHPLPEKPAVKPRRNWERLGLDEQVLMNTAAAVYQYNLWHEPGALEYVRDRGIPDWLIPVFHQAGGDPCAAQLIFGAEFSASSGAD